MRYLEDQYKKGDKQPLEDLVRAWKGIKDLDPKDGKSFFVLGGYHGEPFIYTGKILSIIGADIATTGTSCSQHGTGYTFLK